MKKLIEDEVIALATSNKISVPNVVAVACCHVVDKNKILITDNFMNKTRKNILENIFLLLFGLRTGKKHTNLKELQNT